MSHAALSTRLPRLDPARSRLQTLLFAAIDGVLAGDLVLHAHVADGAPVAVVGFDTPHGAVELSPLIADGAVPLLVADDGAPDAVAAVDALARIEPLVVAIERALGVALRPVSVTAPTLALRLRVDALDAGGTIRHAVTLGIADAGDFAPQPRPLDRDRAERLRTRWTLHLAGPRLATSQLAVLAVGDIVLAGQRELVGAVHSAGRVIPARFRADTATLTIADQQGPTMTDVPNLDPDLRLAVTIVVDGGTASLGDLTRLVPGSVLPLGIAGATLPVTLNVGGDAVAAGELVAIGEAYGVLITRRVGG